ncbi:hypothetical protein KJ980_02150 [Patescibacteria group bacterium]|nr:hypothetical protein [Patescibacteria group bacterium]MBU4016780.1 hypothetical protein [Patescibacteria group bacterium]MBU4098432.1 hypothetical protein [Patescibacteria group bacterium]
MTRKQKLQKPSELIKLYSQKLSHEFERKLSPLGFELNFQYRSPHIAHISGYVVFRIGWILEFVRPEKEGDRTEIEPGPKQMPMKKYEIPRRKKALEGIMEKFAAEPLPV